MLPFIVCLREIAAVNERHVARVISDWNKVVGDRWVPSIQSTQGGARAGSQCEYSDSHFLCYYLLMMRCSPHGHCAPTLPTLRLDAFLHKTIEELWKERNGDFPKFDNNSKILCSNSKLWRWKTLLKTINSKDTNPPQANSINHGRGKTKLFSDCLQRKGQHKMAYEETAKGLQIKAMGEKNIRGQGPSS